MQPQSNMFSVGRILAFADPTRAVMGSDCWRPGRQTRRACAFTLIEMLVVLVIIGILAALTLPHIRGHSESVAIDAATHQLVEDLAFARQKAISQRSVVAVVFLTDAVSDRQQIPLGLADAEELPEIKRLQAGAFTHYAIYQFRRVGEQPGRATEGYITEWKALPEKTFLTTNNLATGGNISVLNLPHAPDSVRFPFPFSRSNEAPTPMGTTFPYIAFDAEGRSVKARVPYGDLGDVVPTGDIGVSISRGAVFYARDPQGFVQNLELQEIPPYNGTGNVIRVDALTGRAKRDQTLLP